MPSTHTSLLLPEIFDPYTRTDHEIIQLNRLYKLARDDNTWAIDDDASSLAAVMAHQTHYIIHSLERKMIGGIAVRERGEDTASIDAMAVYPEFRRRGYGRILAEHALNQCLQKGHEEVIVEAAPQSQGVFRGIGFVVEDTHEGGFATMRYRAKRTSGINRAFVRT